MIQISTTDVLSVALNKMAVNMAIANGDISGLIVNPGILSVAGTVSNAAVLLSSKAALEPGTELVIVQVTTNALRYTVDGTAPTAALGFLVPANGFFQLNRTQFAACKIIRVTNDADLTVSQFTGVV